MRQLTIAEKQFWLSWLESREIDNNSIAGYRTEGWQHSTWILHSIFRITDTNDRPAEPEVPCVMTTPLPSWERLRWSEILTEFNVERMTEFPPGYKTFDLMEFPENIVEPCEGSLDALSLSGLLTSLAKFSLDGTNTPCIAHYSPLASDWNFDEAWLCETTLGEITNLANPDEGRFGTPTNFWPVDKSWMVYSDYDLWGTLVSGSTDLINVITSNETLECFDWDWPLPTT